MSHRTYPVIPALAGAIDTRALQDFLSPLHAQNRYAGFGVCQYDHGLSPLLPAYAYCGGVYSPTQQRVYLVPYSIASQSTWHYIDCITGSVVPYPGAPGVPQYGYLGGAYCPTQDRIYMSPYGIAGEPGSWHYIDCATGNVVAYAAGTGTLGYAYEGSVYSPKQNRVYFVPQMAWHGTNLHYVDCGTSAPTVGTYGFNGHTAVGYAYAGGCYCPSLDRIYFAPYQQANQSVWHYLDCSTGSLEEYAAGAGATSAAYAGAVYSPMQDRVYFVPDAQATFSSTWHYVDCAAGGTVGTYLGQSTAATAYAGGSYSPATNRIYFAPVGPLGHNTWHYVDCSTGLSHEYEASSTSVATRYYGSVYDPHRNSVLFVPFSQATTSPVLHRIQEYAPAEVPPSVAALPLFNNY